MSLHWGACCFQQCHEHVVISHGLPHNLQAYFLIASRIGSCQLKRAIVISSGIPHILKTESSLMRLLLLSTTWFFFRWSPPSLQACYLTAEKSRHMCRLSLYRVALVVVDPIGHLITPEGLLSILQADSLSGRLCISPWLCEAGVRHGRRVWVREAGVWQQVIIRAVMCSRSSVIPGCGVLTA